MSKTILDTTNEGQRLEEAINDARRETQERVGELLYEVIDAIQDCRTCADNPEELKGKKERMGKAVIEMLNRVFPILQY